MAGRDPRTVAPFAIAAQPATRAVLRRARTAPADASPSGTMEAARFSAT